MSLADVKHQNAAQELLARAMKQQRVPHAYIFHGPDGVGKETFALGMAEVLFCHALKTVEPEKIGHKDEALEAIRVGCGTCEDCRALAASNHPDLHSIYRQLNRQHPKPIVRARKALDLGVDVLRHFVIDKVGLTPARGRAKVFIIREADRITLSAQNALLKTLEEPPDRTFIVLLVETLDRLLPTTLSRCQLVGFNALPTTFVRERLAVFFAHEAKAAPGKGQSGANRGAEPGAPAGPNAVGDVELDWCAHASDGSIGTAVALARDGIFKISERVVDGLCHLGHTVIDDTVAAWMNVSKSLGSVYRKRDPEITDTEATRRGLKSILRMAAMWYGDVLRLGADPNSMANYSHRREQTLAWAESVSAGCAAEAIGRIARAEHHLDLNTHAELCIETLLIDLAHVAPSGALPVG